MKHLLATSLQAAPLKVFILAGQSNMEGHAKIETFDYIGDDPATEPLLKMMRDEKGQPRVCYHTWISYLTGKYDGSANGEGTGKLTAGYGARDDATKSNGKIGPEFTFGLTMDAALKEPVREGVCGSLAGAAEHQMKISSLPRAGTNNPCPLPYP